MTNGLKKYGVIFLSTQMSGLLTGGVNGHGWMKKNGAKRKWKITTWNHNSNSTQYLALSGPRSLLERSIMADSETYKIEM